MLVIWSLVPLPFLKPAWTSGSSRFTYCWENFEHYFTSVWDECNCAVFWAFFGIAFLWDWNENWPFPVLWPLLSFPNLLAYWLQHFHSIIFQIKRLQFRMNIWFWDKMNEWAWAKQSNRSRRDTNRGLFSLICSPSSRGGRHEKETHLLAQRYMDNVLDV